MATKVQINGAIIQYAFINQINPVSKKYGYSALIPYDPACPQCQAVINASNAEWQKVAAGSNNPQSLGYTIIPATDTQHIHESVIPMLDPTRHYLQIRAGQDGDAETLIPVYDSVPNLIPNGGIIGNGTIANIQIAAFGYATSGQKGVKYYAQWIQVLKLVENMNAQTGPGAAEVQGGYVADATVLSAAAPQVAQAAAPQVGVNPAINVMPQAGAAAPVANIPSAMPGVQQAAAPVQQYAQPLPNVAAPVAALAQQYAAPVQQYVDPNTQAQQYAAPAQQVYAAPAAPVAAPAQQVYAAPAAPVPTAAMAPAAAMPAAPGMPVAPGMPQ